LTWVGDAWRCTWRDAGVTERDVPVTDATKLAAQDQIGAKTLPLRFADGATKRHYFLENGVRIVHQVRRGLPK
jgi:hypothetical protein